MAVKFFGQFLMERGLVTREAILAAVALQERKNLKLGAMAVALGFASETEVEWAHKAQLTRDLPLGDLMLDLGILKREQLQVVLARQKESHLYIGEALVQVGGLRPEELKAQLEAFELDQAPYRTGQVELPEGIGNRPLWEMTVDLSGKLITRVLGLRFQRGPCRSVSSLNGSHMMAALDLTGAVRARYLLGVSAAAQKQVARAVLREDSVEDEPVEVLDDTVAEFANVVCGNVAAKASQSGIDIRIDPPLLLHPSPEGIPVPASQRALRFPFHLEDGETIELYLVLGSSAA